MDPKRIPSVRDDQNRHKGAQCLEHFERFKHDRGRKDLAGKTQDVIFALDSAGTSHRPPNALRYHFFWLTGVTRRCAQPGFYGPSHSSKGQISHARFGQACCTGVG